HVFGHSSLSSFRLSRLFLKRESRKGLGCRPYINECMTIVGLRFGIVVVALVNLSMNCQTVFLSPCSTYFRVVDVVGIVFVIREIGYKQHAQCFKSQPSTRLAHSTNLKLVCPRLLETTYRKLIHDEYEC
ncbi:hypothetical protein V8G54_018051, partial [Vigna mungo]